MSSEKNKEALEIDTESLKKEIKQELMKREILMGLDDDEIDLFELGKVLWKRWRLIVLLPFVISVLAIGYSLSIPNSFKSQATIFVHSQSSGSGGMAALLGGLSGLGLGSGLTGGGGAEYLMAYLKSHTIAEKIIGQFGVATNPILVGENPKEIKRDRLYKLMESVVSVTKDKDGLLTVAAETTSATLSAELANAYVNLLSQYSKGPAKQKRQFIQGQLEKNNVELAQAEQVFKEFQDQHKIFQIEDQAKAIIDQWVKLESQIVESDISLTMQESLLQSMGHVPELVRIEAQKISEEAKQKGLASASAMVQKKVNELPGLGLQYARLMRDLKVREKVFETLTQQYEMAKISEAEEGSSFEVIDHPEISDVKSKPSRALIVILSFVTAGMLAVFLAFFLEFLEKRARKEARSLEASQAV